MQCELCQLEKITKWFFETDKFIVCNCKTCKTPMYVWKDHKFPTGTEISEMEKHMKENFPGYQIDRKRRKIPEHFHFHCRK